MKKNKLIALFALLMVALNSNAQNNTYNMVIEMANGTKITIGPNEVRNISFNNGEMVMTGEDISSLIAQQQELKERIGYLQAMIENNLALIDANRALINDLINENRVMMVDITELQNVCEKLYNDCAKKEDVQLEIDKLIEKTQRLADQVFGNGDHYDWGF